MPSSTMRYGGITDVTNTVPRPSKRPQAGQPMKMFTTTANVTTPTIDPTVMTTFPSTQPLPWQPYTNHPMPQAQHPSSPLELQHRMNALLVEMQSLMSQWTMAQQQPTNAPPAQMENIVAQMQMMQLQMDQTHQASQLAPLQNMQFTSVPKPQPRAYATTATNQPQQQQRVSSAPRHSMQRRPRDANPLQEGVMVLVEFKRQRMKKYESVDFVSPGQYVIVDGDRGQDCGFVVHCVQRDADGTVMRSEAIDNCQTDLSRIKGEAGVVRRVATEQDIAMLHSEIATSECQALKTCRDIVTRMNLNMEVVDCEYQFDRKKISFYFDSEESVDFRELNTELFRIFGVRIWLENQNNKVKNVVPEGALSHADKVMFQQNGLRPPRRK